MNGEMKKLFSLFLFITVIISCLGIVLTGSVTASQTSAKNAYGESFAVMKVITRDGNTHLGMGNKEYPLNFSFAEKITEYGDYIMLTPLSAVYYLFESVIEVFS